MSKKQRLRKMADKLCYEKYLKPNCEICGESAQQLHHFYRKSSHSHLRFTPENLISLCMSCHFLLTHQNPRLEDKIREKRGEKWFRALQKMAYKKIEPSYQTIRYYQDIINNLSQTN